MADDKKPTPQALKREKLVEVLSGIAAEGEPTPIQTLGKLAQLDDKDPVPVAAGHLAFALNTGLAGHAAAGAARDFTAEDMADLITSALGKERRQIVDLLRKRWPEAPRSN